MYSVINRKRGFTIVELLIVIVIIAILATITILSYKNITDKTGVASLSTDLQDSAKQLILDQSQTALFPETLALTNGGDGLTSSTGNTYEYTSYNSASPKSYCLTATRKLVSYFIVDTGTPIHGACPGHKYGGLAQITNYSINPSVTGGTTTYVNYHGSGSGAGSTELKTDGGYVGTDYYRMTWTAPPSTGPSGSYLLITGLTPGATYTTSGYFRADRNTPIGCAWQAYGTTGNTVTLTANVWKRNACTGVAPASGSIQVTFYFPTTAKPQNGNMLDTDAVMITEGTNLYEYRDGTYKNPLWRWNGDANNSTSTGPGVITNL